MASKCLRQSIPILNRGQGSSRFIEFYDYGAQTVNKNPTVLYVPGFQGSGHGLKSQDLIKHCQAKDLRYVCYDPEATGESKIEDMSNLEFKNWFEDAKTAIQMSKSDKIVLVGSSMGGWISLKMASEFPDLIKGLVLIAPAVNFLRPKYEAWYKSSSKEIQKDQDEGKSTIMDASFGLVPVSKSFVDKSVDMELDIEGKLNIQCPVKIIHGFQDDTVPYEDSLKVMKMISHDNVELIYQKSGDHRMQNETGLELIKRSLDDMLLKL